MDDYDVIEVIMAKYNSLKCPVLESNDNYCIICIFDDMA